MEFNQALTLRERQKFAEGSALASSRDDRNNAFLWKRGVQHSEQTHETNQALQRVMREVAKMKRRIVGGFIPQEQLVTPFPFYIYNIDNATDSTKNAQTFQIRDGLVGFRPQYHYSFTDTQMNRLLANGNYELPLLATGTDGIGFASPNPWQLYSGANDAPDFSIPVTQNGGGSITFDGTTNPMLICSNDPATANPPGVQIVIDPGANAFFQVSFFVKIIDAAGGAYTELWASRNNGLGNPPLFSKTIPNIEQTIAIGAITFRQNVGYFISQVQYGHLMNRYLELAPNPTAPTAVVGSEPKYAQVAQVNRGYWTFNGLSGKMFYPGDVVVDDTVNFTVAALGGCYKSYVCISPTGALTSATAPHGDATNWIFYQVIAHT